MCLTYIVGPTSQCPVSIGGYEASGKKQMTAKFFRFLIEITYCVPDTYPVGPTSQCPVSIGGYEASGKKQMTAKFFRFLIEITYCVPDTYPVGPTSQCSVSIGGDETWGINYDHISKGTLHIPLCQHNMNSRDQ